MSKEKIISFKIEPEAKESFDRLCREKHTTPSHELRLFVHQHIKQSKGKPISLTQFKERKS